MIGDTVGYAEVKHDAVVLAKTPKAFLGKICRVMEFASDGGALVIAPDGSELAMVDKEHISRYLTI